MEHSNDLNLQQKQNDSQEEDAKDPQTSAVVGKGVKSTAVVKYSAIDMPARFLQLSSNTNLNLPPDNWLRENEIGEILSPFLSTGNSSRLLSSLNMANNFPDCVGKVDVISGAENIKQLLKIPYGNGEVSMMVHRVGNTLLLEDFDIHHHLLQAAKKEWEWLRKFFLEHILQSLHHKDKSCFRKNRSRCYLQDKNMLSKFLYYSVADIASSQDSLVPDCPNTPKDECQAVNDSQRVPATHGTSPSDPFPLLQEEIDALSRDHEYQRNVLWTFEDIQMLIGTDMPIFGGGTHPCVSLRLRDITKPINVLTGLDYWLDNLMCNVPEVMMCYHLDGIVQKYELIKTEDIPKLDNSKFSPKVIKDIAQNILSFLKSNATKAGHTYWLFKAKDDDVVKLYDLTTLCADVMDDNDQNPFTVPVAMLLYRVAHNMKSSSSSSKSQLETICTLLKNCLTLLNKKKYPQVATSAHYLLSDLYIPSTLDLVSLVLPPEPESDSENDCDDSATSSDDCAENGNGAASSSVSVKALCRPELINHAYPSTSCHDPDLSTSLENRCLMALRNLEQGLTCLELDSEELSPQDSNANEKTKEKKREEAQQKAKPSQAIPLRYESIASLKNQNVCESKLDLPTGNMPLASRANQWLLSKSWQSFYMGLLFQKASISAYAMAQCLSDKKPGEALRYIELALACYDAIEQIVHSVSQPKPEETPLACCIFGLAGDIHFVLVQQSSKLTELREQYEQFSSFDVIKNSCRNILNRESCYSWAVKFNSKLEEAMLLSSKCYQAALERVHGTEEKMKLSKRLGNIQNELGVYYMSQAHKVFNENGEVSDDVENLFNLSGGCLAAGVKIFEEIRDDFNIAFLYSNLGRLMRLQALCYAPQDSPKEFSVKERTFYEKAIAFYLKAQGALDNKQRHSGLHQRISWDISTIYFTMASLMQDFAPLSVRPHEEVVKDITSFLQKALKYCDIDSTGSKQPLNQFRAANIYHRLGSLNHHSYRNTSFEESRRKQYRTLAEMYLLKSAKLFAILEDPTEYLKVQLERIGLFEYHFSGLLGNSAKLKCLYTILELILETIPLVVVIKDQKVQDQISLAKSGPKMVTEQKPVDKEESGTETIDDCADNDKLLQLLQERLQFALLNCIKISSGKSKKGNDPMLIAFKKLYNEALQQAVVDGSFSVDVLLRTLGIVKNHFEKL